MQKYYFVFWGNDQIRGVCAQLAANGEAAKQKVSDNIKKATKLEKFIILFEIDETELGELTDDVAVLNGPVEFNVVVVK